jgi:hypothetical protein
MRRKPKFLACVVALALLNPSCVGYSRQAATPKALKPGEEVRVVGATRTSGERLEYPGETPAIVRNGELCATEMRRVELHVLPRAEIKEPYPFGESRPDRIVTTDGRKYKPSRLVSVNDKEVRFETRVAVPPPVIEMTKADVVASRSFEDKGRRIMAIRTKEGREYREVELVGEDENTLRLSVKEVCTPLAEYQQLVLRKADAGKTAVYTVGGALLLFAGIIALVAAIKESCPFVYSFDGEQYVFDAEPYGGALCPGLKRTEWCNLEHLREVDGRYRLRLTNEVDETQHTDKLKLLVVDHPAGTQVVPDERGALHTVASPEPPLSARDRLGRDLLPLVTTGDAYVWESQLEGGDDAWDATLREELTFEFPKPKGATRARLLFNGCNSLWASQMLKRYLELHGREVQACYGRLNTSPLFRGRLAAWSAREELYQLQIRVETPRGWVTKGTVMGGGPFISETRAYPIDVRDVEGDHLRVRLLPAAGFWKVDSVAVDYGDGLPTRVREIAPLEAVDDTGADLREALAATDDRYASMPEIGQWAEITFASPPRAPGSLRSFVVKASGYYDIHLSARGDPRRDILARYQSEPGFWARFALQEYRRFVADTQASLATR